MLPMSQMHGRVFLLHLQTAFLLGLFGATISIQAANPDEKQLVEVLRSNRALNVAAAVGQRLPAHATASGKVFMAYLPSTELDLILKQPLKAFTQNTLTSADDLCNALEQVRSQGYGVDMEEFEEGIRAIAVPIFNRQGQVMAAMGAPIPVSRIALERIGEIAEAYKKTAGAISRRMGWNRS